MKLPTLLVVACLFAISACQAPSHDYSSFEQYYPTSILVLPPIDATIEVDATYGYLSVVTKPLAERGYYVFPVAIVDRMMRENGLIEPTDMHAVPLEKLVEVFNPDAVLYVTLTDWGTEYMLFDSQTRVTVTCRLVDADTGVEFWASSKTAVSSSSSGQSDILGMLVLAVVNQVTTSISDPTLGVAREANDLVFLNRIDGLLLGERHSGYAAQRKEMKAAKEEASKEEAE